MITTSAPGKIVIFGDLAAVYDKLAISAAIDLRTKVSIKKLDKGEIYSSKYKKTWKYDKKELIRIKKKYDKIISNKEFEKLRTYPVSHPIKYLLSKIFNDIGYKNLKISIDTKGPKGIGSSSSLSCALTLGVYELFGHKISKKKIAALAIYHDKIAHGGMPSGIDSSTSNYGGIVSYRKNEGIKKLNIKPKLSFLVVESKTLLKTSISVNRINNLLKTDFEKTNDLLDEVDTLSKNSIQYFRTGNKQKLGKLMYQNQNILKKLGVSTKNVDSLIKFIKKKYNIHGAKLTGGGAGSIIILADNYSNIIKDLNKRGFKTYLVDLGAEGVKKDALNIKGVIFDADNVLYYRNLSSDRLKIRLLKKFGYEEAYGDFEESFEKEEWLGYTKKIDNIELFRRTLRNINLKLDNNSLKKFINEFFKIHKKVEKVDGALKTLKKLNAKRIKICVLTDTIFTENEKRSWFKSIGMEKYIDMIVCSYDIKKTKDKKESYEECLKRMKLKHDEVVFVGHKQYEMNGAKKANVVSVAILPISDKNIKSDCNVNSIQELLSLT